MPGPRFRFRFAAALIATVLVSAFGCRTLPPTSAIPDASPPALDFDELVHLCQVYVSVRFEESSLIYTDWEKYYAALEVVEITDTRNLYLVGKLRTGCRQEVVIRGTTNPSNTFNDVRFHKHRNQELGVRLHAGFEAMALALYRDLLPRLDRECELVIFGHSLGAAEAVILAMLLERDGYRVHRVYATGQPKVTDKTGALKYKDLPVVRIVNANDPVPLLPPRNQVAPGRSYWHMGGEFVLLDGPYFAYLSEGYANDLPATAFVKNLRQQKMLDELHEHAIGNYLARLSPKLEQAIQVPFQTREYYTSGSRATGTP